MVDLRLLPPYRPGMDRRRFLDRRRLLLTGLAGALAAPLAAAQQAGRVYRIGVVSSGGPEQEHIFQTALRQRLRERGWVEGQNLVMEWRYADGQYEKASELVHELLRLTPHLLLTRGGPVTKAAKQASDTVPIVMWGVTDPVGIGVVSSLARPGGNVTGLSDDPSPEMIGKRLQLLKQVAPAVTRVAHLTRVAPSDVVPRIAAYEHALEAGAKALGLVVRPWRLQRPDDIDRAFSEIGRDGFQALTVDYVPVTWANRRRILARALRYRLPAIYAHRAYVVEGGLMAYGEDEREVPQRLALYVDRILRNTKPAELPIEQPSKIEMVVNLKTAKALDVAIPPSLLARADQVIE